jgi:hypothetical protein
VNSLLYINACRGKFLYQEDLNLLFSNSLIGNLEERDIIGVRIIFNFILKKVCLANQQSVYNVLIREPLSRVKSGSCQANGSVPN